MNKALDFIVREFNPKYDFEKIRFFNHIKYDHNHLKELWNAQLKNLANFLAYVKPLARGALVGSSIGLAASLFSDEPAVECARVGAAFGMALDYFVYGARFLKHYLGAQKDNGA